MGNGENNPLISREEWQHFFQVLFGIFGIPIGFGFWGKLLVTEGVNIINSNGFGGAILILIGVLWWFVGGTSFFYSLYKLTGFNILKYINIQNER